jgi:NodT family efflux transporter outer membrane factor (OMF) lipoprotein
MTIQYGYFKKTTPMIHAVSSPRSYLKASAALLAVLTLGACTTVPQSAPFGPEPSQAQKVNPIADLNEQAWWTGFNDPQLNSIMTQAFANSPDLAAAAGRLYKAQAMVGKAKAGDLPSLSLLGTGQSLASSAPGSLESLEIGGLNFSYEFDFWGKNRAAVAAASTSAKAAAADQAQARLVLSSAIASAYVDLADLYDNRDLAERAVALKKENLDLVQKKRDQGLVSEAELQLAKAGAFNAQADLAFIDEQIALGRNRISALAGLDPSFGQGLTRPALQLPAATTLPDRIDLNLIGRRPDVVAARWRAEAASQSIKQAHAAYWPNINILAFAGSLALGDPLHLSQTMANAGPAITLPIFDGGKLNANLKGAEGDHAVAIASYNGTVVTAMREVADAVASQRALGARLSQASDALDASEKAYELVKSRYDGGLTDYATLLIAEQNLITQRRVVTDLKSRALTLDIALTKALGGQYQGPYTAS